MGAIEWMAWRALALLAGVLLVLSMLTSDASVAAQYRGGAGRSAARSSVHGSDVRSGAHSNVNRNANANRNANVNVNRNANVNVNRNVDVDVHHSHDYDRWGNPVAAAVAVGAAAVAIGTVVAALPPRCTAVVAGSISYQNCGGVYYQPVYQGSAVQYVVVKAP